MNKVLHFRAKSKLSQKALADLVGCTQPTIAAIEAGGTTNVNLAQLIAGVFKQPVEVVFPPQSTKRKKSEAA